MYLSKFVESRLIRRIGRACIIFGFSFSLAFNATAESTAEQTDSSDAWEYKAILYGWLPTIDSETPGGHTLEIDIETIIRNLDGIAMAGFQARNGRWTAHTDILYFGISDGGSNDITIPVGPFNIEKTVDVEVEMDSGSSI